MPRPRSNHHSLGNTQPQPSHEASTMYSQPRSDPQVQRSQGVIFLSTNKPQVPPSQPPPPPLQAHPHLTHQVNQVPAHHASMFQSQHVPAFVPPSIISNPFFPYYHPLPPQAATPAPLNDVYTPNGGGGGGGYDQSMQAPPSPIRSKSRRRSRYTANDSESSSDAEFNDDEEDPDWNPTAGDEAVEPVFENRRGTPRGRRASTTPRGRGGGGRGRGSRGGGRGRGRGRGRGGHVDVPPTLVDQTAQMHMAGRQTRSTLSMPSLDPQSGQMSFGELVSAAVQSLNDPEDEYSTGRSSHKKQKSLMAAVIITQPNKTILIERVPLSGPSSIFVPVDTTVGSGEQPNKDELALEAEDEDLIMAYEIVQEDDKLRPFLCEICGKESRSRVLHNRHLVTHAPSLPFACCICSQLFENHEKLKPHLRMHHGSGIFVCPELDCEGVFQERKSLDDHDFACHPNARPFVCRFCLDRFPSVEEAHAHEDTHDEDITASCLKCSATYKTKTDLKNHYSHMHEEKQCKFCESKFENQPTYDDHLNEVHPEKLKPPTPPREPTPELIADDDPMPSPPGGNDDDDDEIVVVEERKKAPAVKPTKTPENRKVKRPEPRPALKPGPKPGSSKPGPKPKPAFKPKPTTTSDIITLSSDSDDDKDPEWAPGGKKSRKSYIPSSPVKRSSRRKAEYVIIVESRTEETANDVLKKTSKSGNQPLTFVMGDSGDLVHVPTSSDPHPPDSLPIKEIMDVIKNKKLTDNTTIVIENNKVTSVQPSGSQKSAKPGPLSRTTSEAKTWVGSTPPPNETSRIKPTQSSGLGKPSDMQTKPKPSNLVAKKRTGGLSRVDIDKRQKPPESPSSNEIIKPKPAAPIAKKRTGGSSSVYDSMKQKSEKQDDYSSRKEKQPRKEAHKVLSDLDDDPLIVEEHTSSQKSVLAPLKPSKSTSSHKHKKKGKRGRKKSSSKSQRRQEKAKRQLQADQAANEVNALSTDYDLAPKRSLRIALKASVVDANGEESSPSSGIGIEDPIDSVLSPAENHKKRGRPSSKTHPPNQNNTDSNITGGVSASTSAASNGQVVMKALVNGKWQDVVIGTKLASEHNEPVQNSNVTRMERAPKHVNAKKSTGGNKRQAQQAAKITSGNRGGRRSGSGRKGKNAKQSADCWRDDRYQYFSDGSRTTGHLDTTSHMYSVPDTVPFKDDTSGDYDGITQGYGTDDTVLPFSLSSYMNYHQDESPPAAEPEDHGLPVIVSAYHVDASRSEVDNYQDSYVDNAGQEYKEDSNNIDQEGDEAEDVDEIPLRDPLAMDDAPVEEDVDEDPLGCSEPVPQPLPPPVVVEPKKGTVQEAKSAISNLRSVLSQITFKR